MISKKGIGKIIGGILLVIFLDLAITSFSFYQITDQQNMRSAFTSIIADQFNAFDDKIELLKQACASNPGSDIPVPTELTAAFGITSLGQCSDIASASTREIKIMMASKSFDTIYEKDYGCGIVDYGKLFLGMNKGSECMKTEKALGIISSRIHNESLVATYVFIILSLLSAALLWFSTNGAGRLKAFGGAFITVGIIGIIFVLIPSLVFAGYDRVAPLINLIFNTMAINHLVFLVIGIALIIGSYFFRRKD